MLSNVVADRSRGRCGIGVDRDVRAVLANRSQLTVIGAEIMPPHADAVSFVDRKERDIAVHEQSVAVFRTDAFGSEIEELEPAFLKIAADLAALLHRLRAVEEPGFDAAALKAVDLILHQRDQGGDHDGTAVHRDGRRLEAERLSAASGEDDDGITVLEHGRHCFGLQRAEFGVAPELQKVLFERSEKIRHQ